MMYRRMNPKQLEKVIAEVIAEKNLQMVGKQVIPGEKTPKMEESVNNNPTPIVDRCLNGQRSPWVRLNEKEVPECHLKTNRSLRPS